MKKLLSPIVLGVMFIAACTHFEEPTPLFDKQQDESQTRSTSLTNLQDPYALRNVQAAWDIIAQEQELEPYELQATHHYVRFLPQDSTDVYIILDSLDLDLWTYPYDQDLTQEEIEEHENTLINGYNWLYTLVDADMPMPTEMDCEVLNDIYFQPGEENEEDGANISTRSMGVPRELPSDIYDAVIDKSLELTGRTTPQMTRGSNRWFPSAHVSYIDEFGTKINLVNVRVIVTNKSSVNFDAYTDQNGWAYIKKHNGNGFVDNLKYHVKWETGKWKIKTNNGASVGRQDDPDGRKREKWIYEIDGSVDNKAAMRASIHRALNAYYCENIHKAAGLVKHGNINVRARWNEADPDGSASAYFRNWAINEIHVFGKNSSGTSHSRHQMFCYTFHELGHASHYQAIEDMIPGNGTIIYIDYDKALKETWAQGVQYAYSSSFYPTEFQDPMEYHGSFTAIIESLMNQGFTLRELQDIFMSKTKLSQCRQPIKDLNRVPDMIIDMIFDTPLGAMKPFNGLITGDNHHFSGLNIPFDASIFRNTSTLPTGVTFDGWTITGNGVTPADYSTRSLSNLKLNIRFLAEKYFILSANYTLPDGTPHVVTKRFWTRIPGGIAIIGDNTAALNSQVTYSIPEMQSGGFTFAGWEISPGTRNVDWTASSMSAGARTLDVTFRKYGNYAVVAKYNLPDRSVYRETINVSVTDYVPEIDYEIYESGIQPMSSGPVVLPPVTPPLRGKRLKFYVTNSTYEFIYEWMVNGYIPYNPSIYLTGIYETFPDQMHAMSCRANYGDSVSPWSNTILLDKDGNEFTRPVIVADQSVAARNSTVTFTVQGANGYCFEWEKNGQIVVGQNLEYFSTSAIRQYSPLSPLPGPMKVRCRIKNGDFVSEWSDEVIVTVGAFGNDWGVVVGGDGPIGPGQITLRP